MPAATPVALKSLNALYSLNEKEASQALAFQLRGTVLCYDAQWNQLFIHDQHDTTYFDPRGFSQSLHAGQVVEITGTTTWSEHRPALTNLTLRVLGTAPLPSPRRLNLTQLATAPGEWIETEAVVRVAETSKGRLGLVLNDLGRDCVAYVMGPSATNDVSHLIGCRIRISGINTTVAGAGSDAFGMIVPSLSRISVLDNSGPSFRTIPVMSIESLLTAPLGPWTNQPVHLQGTILAGIPGDHLVLKDPTGTIRARTLQAAPVDLDARIDLWGYLRLLPDQTVLDDAYYENAPVPIAHSLPHASLPGDSKHMPTLPLTSIHSVAKLSPRFADQGLPVRLQGVVTYADPRWGTAFLQNPDDAIYFELADSNVKAGDWIELSGRTASGTFAPVISNSTVKVLSHTNFPTPIKAVLPDLADGHLDSHWIQLEGLVQRVDLEPDRLRLTLVTPDGRFHAVVPGTEPLSVPLVDARVRLTGACGAELNARNQLTGVLLHVPSVRQMKILEPAPKDPFSIPPTPIAEVATFDPNRQAGHRLKVVGTVTLVLPGQAIFVQDRTGGIRLLTAQTDAVKVGSSIEALGFPVFGEFSPQLTEVSVRAGAPGAWPTVVKTTAEQILINGTNDASLVQLDAQLLQQPTHAARPQLILRDGSVIFTAQLQSRALVERAIQFRPGSTLRLTGICTVQGNERHDPQSFRLLLTQPTGLLMLHAPPAWSWRQVQVAAVSLLLLAILILGWIVALRRQVRSRTADLAYERHLLAVMLDNLPDAVYFKDRQSRFVRVSKSFTQLFKFDDLSAILGKTDFDFFTQDHARPAFNDEQEIIRTGQPVIGKVERETHLDGRISWALTSKMPWRNDHGHIIGTFGVSKDVTPIKEAELKLEALHKQLLQASRQAGMAEVANSILHNVGNVLNSVNVSTSLLLERASRSKGGDLSRIVELLNQHTDDLAAFLTHDPKGRMIPHYLRQLADHLGLEQAAALSELCSLAKNVDHVKTIIAMQQSYAKVAGIAESVAPTELLEDALRFNSGALARHQVQVVRCYDPQLPPITVDKHKVLQILVNLIRNAKYACDESHRSDKCVKLGVDRGHGSIVFSIADNGVGIPEENLTRIFNHGFSTRKGGHGFGLHSSAPAARELGGSLLVSSPGPGQGATFILELPLSPESATKPESAPAPIEVTPAPEPSVTPELELASAAPSLTT